MVLGWLVSALVASAGGSDVQLRAAGRILAAGEPISVDEGHAAPALFDVDGDGKRDLLVGQFGGGKVRWYRNVGSDPGFRFEGFEYLTHEDKELTVPYGCCIGFTPYFADLDGDGLEDLISGSYQPGDIHWFRNLGVGKGFAPQGPLPEQTRGSIVRTTSSAFPVDLDRDGLVDFVIGNIRGEVHMLLNRGTRERPSFPSRQPVVAGGRPLRVGGDGGPIAVDWDGDGNLDLIVGNEAGDLAFVPGTGRDPRGLPTFGEPRPIRVGAEELRLPMRAKPYVVDWNGDGGLDLLVGNFSTETAPSGETRLVGYVYLFLRVMPDRSSGT